MTHYYYYISAGATWDGTTEVYKVGIGTSVQGRRDFLYLTAHCVDHKNYFEPVSSQSDSFILQVLHSLEDFGTKIQHVSSRALVRSFKTDGALSYSPAAIHNAHAQRMALDLGYRVQCKINARRA